MTFYTRTEALAAASQGYPWEARATESASFALRKSAAVRNDQRFDIFLSHSFKDAQLILGVKAILEAQGRSVYVDWVTDGHLDRKAVTKENADLLRQRMNQCSSLIFATSETSTSSLWMPWELGYFDGLRSGRIAIFPLVEYPSSNFNGQEYLLLYPYMEKLALQNGGTSLFATRTVRGQKEYITLPEVVAGSTNFKRL